LRYFSLSMRFKQLFGNYRHYYENNCAISISWGEIVLYKKTTAQIVQRL
jgi:hypothetical protein